VGGEMKSGMLRPRKKRGTNRFALALHWTASPVCRPKLQLMRSRSLFCAVLATFCAQLHAQSTTGIYVNPSNNVGIGTTAPGAALDVETVSGGGAFNLKLGDNAGTSWVLGKIVNGGGTTFFGTDDSAGAYFAAGAYASAFGSNSPTPTTLITNGAARLTILGTGNVGIGTTNPLRQFMLYNSYPVIGFQTSGDGLGWGIYSDASDDSIKFIRYSNAAWTSYNNNIFTILTNGNVGIGTVSPTTKLAVAGDAALNGPGHAYFAINGSSGDSEAFWQENGANLWAVGMHVGDGTENFNLYNYTTGITELSVNKTTGYVGIGTGSPGYMLDVAGQVHASSFVASSGNTYADFVFKPGYKLEPLSDVEASIQKNGHLPGIPSEAEAKAHGIDLASMQVKLLQKIEELTLHEIEQEKHQINDEKKLSAQETKLSDQAQRIENLEKENAELREKLAK
jgi:hypothetical protein